MSYELIKVAQLSDLPVGSTKLIETNGLTISLFNAEGTVYAIDNTCTHAGGPLCEGTVEEHIVTCPWHGAKFDITTGANIAPPAKSSVTSYKTEVKGEDVFVAIMK